MFGIVFLGGRGVTGFVGFFIFWARGVVGFVFGDEGVVVDEVFG